MNLLPRAAVEADADDLELRYEDALEVSPGWRVAVKEQIRAGGVVAFHTHLGRLAGLYGVQKQGEALIPWLLCSDVASEYPRDVWRYARAAMGPLRNAAAAGFVVGNKIPASSERNRDFVRKLGFQLNDEFFTLQPPH